MSDSNSDDISVTIMSVYMKIVGLWMATNPFEQRVRKITLIYTLFALLVGLCVESGEFYHSWGDFSASLHIACNGLTVVLPFCKILLLLSHKKDFFHLIVHLQRKFLRADYDDYERTLLLGCKRQCTFFICAFTIFTQVTAMAYYIDPLIANIGRNESDRILPFNIWLNLPLSLTPYYEVTYAIELFSSCQIGLCYCCIDNCLCIMNLHAATQFQILQHRMANIADVIQKGKQAENIKVNVNSPCFATECYTVLKNYIRQHQKLIAFCKKLQKVFNMIVLLQVLMFSLLICLGGYQVLIASAPVRTRLIFIFHLSACMCQLLMFTYSCDRIIRESTNTATAVYSGPWTLLSMTPSGKKLRNDLVLIIMRSSVPCFLTAKGFFIVSLETYTGVLSTAASYFTLLKQSSENTDIS